VVPDARRVSPPSPSTSLSVVALAGISGPLGAEIASQLDVDAEVERIIGLDRRQPANAPEKLLFRRLEPGLPLADLFRQEGVKGAFLLDGAGGAVDPGPAEAESLRSQLDACAECGAETVLVLSGAAVYGSHADNPNPIEEGAALRPDRAAQGAACVARERLVAEFARRRAETATIVARLAPLVGPGTDGPAARYLASPRLVALRGFDPPLQFVHLEDAALALFKLAKARRTGVFNIAPDDAIPPTGIARLLKRRLLRLPGWMARALRGFGAGPEPGIVDFLRHPLVLSNRKLKRETLYGFRYSSESALLDHVRAARGATPS